MNNVYSAPARPPTPEPLAPEPEPVSAEPQPAGYVNGVLSTVKDAAVAMVEAIAPGTTETPQPTPAIATDESKDVALAAVDEKEPTAEVVESATSEAAEDVPAPAPAPEEPTPHEELTAEAVLPQPAEQTEAAPAVPVPVLPLAAEDKSEQLETTIVEGSATGQPEAAVEPSTHTPVDVPTANGHAEKVETTIVEGATTNGPTSAVEPSTHTPAPPTEETVTSNGTNGTLVEPSTHTPAAPAEKTEPATTNGTTNGIEAKPETIPLPPPTPAEVPLPATPSINGNGKASPPQPSSVASSPQASPRKEHKRAFPTFGKHRRTSSSIASVNTQGTDEHGSIKGGSPASTHRKKRTSSIFGKIREIFSDSPKKAHA